MTENNELQAVQGDVLTGKHELSEELSESNVQADLLNTVPASPLAKVQVFNALQNPTDKLSNKINQTINLVDVVGQYVEIEDDATGTKSMQPRLVLITDKGESYDCVSQGVMNSMKQIFAIFGQPHYETGLPLKVLQKQSSRNAAFKFISLEVDMEAYKQLHAND